MLQHLHRVCSIPLKALYPSGKKRFPAKATERQAISPLAPRVETGGYLYENGPEPARMRLAPDREGARPVSITPSVKSLAFGRAFCIKKIHELCDSEISLAVAAGLEPVIPLM